MIESLPTLYKRDTKGKIRVWTIEYTDEEPGIRTIAGLEDGKQVTSAWKKTEGKNTGKSNETTDCTQAIAEAKGEWNKKVEKEYFENVDDIDSYTKFQPQLAHDYSKRPQFDGLSQPKLDGIRCIARKDGLYTRSGKEINTCPHIEEYLKEFFEENPHVILDGELYNHELKEDFNKITSLVRKESTSIEEAAVREAIVQYHVYDCVFTTSLDAKFSERISFVSDVFNIIYLEDGQMAPVQSVPTVYCGDQDALDERYSFYQAEGYEGQMVRNDTPYENKRSKNLLKRKEFITEEYDVVAVLEGSGNWEGYAKHFTLDLGDGRTFNSGVRGNQQVLKELLEQEVKPTWVTCRYFEKTPDGIPRFPVVIDWGVNARDD